MATPRMTEKYLKEVAPALKEQLNIENVNNIPRFEKIVVNMGVGGASQDAKLLEAAMNDMRTITGQQPCITRARKSIAGFKIREGQAIGCKVIVADASGREMPAYKIVGSQEADPMHGIISEESPFGKALLGAKEGDTVVVEAPRGSMTYTLQKIER